MFESDVQVMPILRIFDEAKAREFYVGFLGFSVDWEHRFEENAPLYMQVSRGKLAFHLSEHYGDGCPGSTVFVRMTGIEEFHRELIAKKYKYLRPGLQIESWNARSMQVNDPFGNRIRFSEDLKPENGG
ncbi:MAG: glyoxalase/bleomycin resistance/extradiol dioxygenase family protein [Planctomycetota bacterium]|nr:glyoxalase/bleomycin resistance/extradiol dioxygenase family protein [Planctomycetota bacterium]